MRRLLLLLSLVLSCKSAPRGRPEDAWSAPLERSHPLVGQVWDTARHTDISRAELFRRVGDAEYVLLGEAHDNPDHHRLQAQALSAVLARGVRPTLAWEMLEPKQQPLIDAFFASGPRSVVGFGDAVGWDRGWPPFSQYAPIARAGAEAQLRFVAANVARDEARAIARGELTPALPAWDPELERDLVDELVEQHCGHVTREKAAPMALAQRARDAHMADVLLTSTSAVLIAGAEHARTDRGVPYYLRAKRPEARIVSVAFVEVVPEAQSPDAYARILHAGVLPFDYVWFSPRILREDPCAGMRAVGAKKSAL